MSELPNPQDEENWFVTREIDLRRSPNKAEVELAKKLRQKWD